MLQKLRSRHPIDLPMTGFRHKRGILVILGGIALLFVIVPFLLSPLVALSATAKKAVVLVGAGFGTLLVVLLIGTARGKFGGARS